MSNQTHWGTVKTFFGRFVIPASVVTLGSYIFWTSRYLAAIGWLTSVLSPWPGMIDTIDQPIGLLVIAIGCLWFSWSFYKTNKKIPSRVGLVLASLAFISAAFLFGQTIPSNARLLNLYTPISGYKTFAPRGVTLQVQPRGLHRFLNTHHAVAVCRPESKYDSLANFWSDDKSERSLPHPISEPLSIHVPLTKEFVTRLCDSTGEIHCGMELVPFVDKDLETHRFWSISGYSLSNELNCNGN